MVIKAARVADVHRCNGTFGVWPSRRLCRGRNMHASSFASCMALPGAGHDGAGTAASAWPSMKMLVHAPMHPWAALTHLCLCLQAAWQVACRIATPTSRNACTGGGLHHGVHACGAGMHLLAHPASTSQHCAPLLQTLLHQLHAIPSHAMISYIQLIGTRASPALTKMPAWLAIAGCTKATTHTHTLCSHGPASPFPLAV